jgi:transposase
VKRVLAIILGGGAGTRLQPLTLTRAKPAVPLGGNYRLIDIPISNCINSGISKIYALTQFNSQSLNRHISLTYNLFSAFNGGFVEVCQPTSKTEPEATRKLSHLDPSGSIKPTATAGMLEAVVSPQQEPSTAGVGFGMAQASRPRALRGLNSLEGAMQTPEEVLVMRQLLERGWIRRRIAAELGISRNMLNRYLAIGDWQPYSSGNRSSQLDGHQEWLQQQFEQHHGNAEVVRQELLKQKGIRVSQRTVERAVQPWREALRQSAQATVRYETRPGKQLQADFGELWVPIGGVQTKVHFCLLTLGYSRRQLIRVYRQQQQRHWLQALEEAFRFWGGVPEQVLVDNARALISLNNPRTGELVVNPTFAAFARHWGFTPKACWPHRPQTKGKDERGVGYVKRSGLAGHRFDTWGQMESHLEWWNREIADVRIHGTTGEQPLVRFQRDEARALLALNGKPSYLAEQEFSRRVAKDCCVQVEGNWYSVPVALVGQNVTVQVRDQQVVIRQAGRIVARHTRQEANQRSRQVIAGHWAGLVPQRVIEAAHADGLAEVVTLDAVRRSSLARPLSDYAAAAAEVG